MAYVPTETDLELADAILEATGASGFYQVGTGVPLPLQVQWIGFANELAFAERSGANGRPYESAAHAYVGYRDVPEPEQGALVWFVGGDKHKVENFAPEGGLYRLDVIPEDEAVG